MPQHMFFRLVVGLTLMRAVIAGRNCFKIGEIAAGGCKQIILEGAGLGDEDLVSLVSSLQPGSNDAELTGIVLDHNSISDEGAVALAAWLSSNKVLNSLSLLDNQIGERGGSALAEALRTNSALRVLDLERNHIGDGGAAAVGRAIGVNGVLESLVLDRNDIGDAGAAGVGVGLADNARLSMLFLSGNRIGDVGAAAIGAALRTNGALAHLSLARNEVGDAGAEAILAGAAGPTAGEAGGAARRRPTLQRLSLDSNAALDRRKMIEIQLAVQSAFREWDGAPGREEL